MIHSPGVQKICMVDQKKPSESMLEREYAPFECFLHRMNLSTNNRKKVPP